MQDSLATVVQDDCNSICLNYATRFLCSIGLTLKNSDRKKAFLLLVWMTNGLPSVKKQVWVVGKQCRQSTPCTAANTDYHGRSGGHIKVKIKHEKEV